MADVDAYGHTDASRSSWRYTHIAAGTATTVVKSAPGKLHAIVINSNGASSNTITVYDNTAGSGTTIAVIDGAGVAEQTLQYDAECLTGITIVSASGTGADMTVLWA